MTVERRIQIFVPGVTDPVTQDEIVAHAETFTEWTPVLEAHARKYPSTKFSCQEWTDGKCTQVLQLRPGLAKDWLSIGDRVLGADSIALAYAPKKDETGQMVGLITDLKVQNAELLKRLEALESSNKAGGKR